MTGDDFARDAAAVSLRWAASLREMGYLHAAVELDDAADRLHDHDCATLDECMPATEEISVQTHVA